MRAEQVNSEYLELGRRILHISKLYYRSSYQDTHISLLSFLKEVSREQQKSVHITTNNYSKSRINPILETSCVQIYLRRWTVSNITFL
jgi:hypothetical protein